MTVERIKKAAAARGLYFDGVKKWRNNCVGYAYEIDAGRGIGCNL